MKNQGSTAKGFTLVELVMSMTIISVALLGTILTINTAVKYSADPLLTHQAVSIAESYLEEMVSKDFPITPCPAGTRSSFTNICQYNGLSEVPTDQTHTAIAGLGAYTVNVTVDSGAANLGSPSLTTGTQGIRIDVKVSHTSMQTLTFSVYRTNY